MTTILTLTDLFGNVSEATARDFRNAQIHMVGIGGSGMAGLAAMLLQRGARVTGTDQRRSVAVDRLVRDGARVMFEDPAGLITPQTDLVVASAAISESHSELVAARERGVRVIKYAQMLGLLMDHYEGAAISGTHGKSTTTAWLAYVLGRAGLEPNFVVGADVPQLGGGSGVGSGSHFVVEACEFDRSFLNLRPRRAAILNIDEDHLDCYANLDAIEEAFAEFGSRVAVNGLVVLNGENASCRRVRDRIAARVEAFGETEDVDWQAARLDLSDGTYSFDVRYRGKDLGRARLSLSGRHNVLNALAVIALAHDCGVSWPKIREALFEFQGASRRLELRGELRGVRVVDDYAHHPAEIRATLLAARERFRPRKLWCVFQPHQHSRTRFLLADFARSFEQADFVVVPEIYFVRDSERDRQAVCAEDLVEQIRERGGDARYVPEFDAIVDIVAACTEPGDVVMTMGAGNIWKVADALVGRLGGILPQ